ncbi:LuxR C-terminal-related transcriptional regulator [Mesorhizobium sp. ES1-1]|uniref:LuxR C-terminal-related transcriptional regulator n=1 Tax=Mesorhizobium sp. ES1-1 TaxID=2876629 RepID=UPI001CCCAEBC|nr:response regulator transcription factor [Mesorhizobium sp. ES1-1]MBZ9675790.1 response regulator transcription factor [Mesorhizobium sp. ES1-1]
MSGPVRIAIFDDHPLFREGVSRSIAEVGGFLIVGQGATAAEAEAHAASGEQDIVLLDISMPGGGLEAAARILAKAPSQKIVVLTASEVDADVARALAIGVRGYVVKGVGANTLAEILRGVAAGERYVSPTLSARLLTDLMHQNKGKTDLVSQLSEREAEVLNIVAEGLSNKEVAIKLGLQEKTVKHHMTQVMTKLKARNRTEAAILLHQSKKRDL